MIHDFGIVWTERGLLLNGLANTTILSALCPSSRALLLGFVLDAGLDVQKARRARTARTFVDGMRCIPFLLFAYIVYYGFPSLGINLDNWSAGLVALTIYNAAYMAEILRGAWVAMPREPIEAGCRLRLFRAAPVPPHHSAAAAAVGGAGRSATS